MTEAPSHTSNHQRLAEMFLHLTPHGATIPYNMCFDSLNCIWVATKSGLFKFDSTGVEVLFARRNDFPRKIAPYCSVLCVTGKIVYAFCEDKSGMTELRILDANTGDELHEQLIDGKIQSLVASANGDLFITKQPSTDESAIFRAHIDSPLAWDEVVTSDECAFQALCVLDDKHLIAATTSVPINIYSKQSLKKIDINEQRVVAGFSCAGKNDGEIYFPRCIQRLSDNEVLVLDKTGRLQRFDCATGHMLGVMAAIDAYIGNGFLITGEGEDKEAVVVCSGIVLDQKGRTLCDDWLEKIRLDGSRWTPIPEPAT